MITDEREFIEQGYPCYLSFYNRTQYAYRSDRRQKHRFEHWARTLFRFPQIQRLGAYREGQLVGMIMFYQIGEVIYCSTLTSATGHHELGISDALFHAVRESAAHSEARQIYMGPVTGIKGLDEYKLLRGCKLVSKPAYYLLNGLALRLLRRWRSAEYRKLVGAMDISREGS
jgi:hypothetical protein